MDEEPEQDEESEQDPQESQMVLNLIQDHFSALFTKKPNNELSIHTHKELYYIDLSNNGFLKAKSDPRSVYNTIAMRALSKYALGPKFKAVEEFKDIIEESYRAGNIDICKA
eukprot:Pgem_evm1s1199